MSGRRNPFKSAMGQLLYMIGARPSQIIYSLAIDEEDVNRSHLFRFGLGTTVLRSLVENSVVGAAASLVDDARNQGIPLLPGSSDVNKDQQQRGITSALLSATTFNLKKASFSDGRVVLQALGAISNNKENSIGKQRMLPFTIRASIATNGENNALASCTILFLYF